VSSPGFAWRILLAEQVDCVFLADLFVSILRSRVTITDTSYGAKIFKMSFLSASACNHPSFPELFPMEESRPVQLSSIPDRVIEAPNFLCVLVPPFS